MWEIENRLFIKARLKGSGDRWQFVGDHGSLVAGQGLAMVFTDVHVADQVAARLAEKNPKWDYVVRDEHLTVYPPVMA